MAESTERIVQALVNAYQRHGFQQVSVPAAALLTVVESREELESALGVLLDEGTLVPMGNAEIALAPEARIALLGRSTLGSWIDRATREPVPAGLIYRENIIRELSDLTRWALAATLPDDLTQRAAELAGVLATDLHLGALDVVAAHGGHPRSRLATLTAARRGSITVEGLRNHLRHNVSTLHAP
jgi:hypothetical protein